MSTPETDGVRTRVHELIARELRIDVESVDTDLLESGLIDSLALVTLIYTVEREFACELPLEEFDLEHFRSITSIASFVAQQNSPSSLVR